MSIHNTPITLKEKCARAARLACTFAPSAASHAVTVVPHDHDPVLAEVRNAS